MEVDCELISPQEAARRLSLGKTKFYELLGTGVIPSVRVGKLRRVPARALRAFVDQLVVEQVGPQADAQREQSRQARVA